MPSRRPTPSAAAGAALALLLAVASVGPAAAARRLRADDSEPQASNATSAAAFFSGDATAYSEAVKDGTGFACSYRKLNPWSQRYFAAINAEQWDDGAACGRCVSVRCTDERCTATAPVTLYIVDKCPECAHGALDLSIPAYKEVTGLWPHRLAAQWSFVECPADDFGGTTLQWDPKDGINAQWSAFYVSNSRVPLKSVALDGAPLERQTYGFWTHPAPLGPAPHTVEIVAADGQTAKAVLDDVLKTQDLGIQF